MQDLPSKEALLGAVAHFLDEEILPATTDRRLAFRVRIAAHLLGVVSRELEHGAAHDARERAGLEGLVPSGAIPAMNAELARHLREDALSDAEQEAILAHLLGTLRDKLAVINPRFNPSLEV